jgi:hypothetical protein
MASNVFAGLGISPAQMFFDNLSPGAHVEKTFVLSRSDYQKDIYFKVNIEGVTKDWITIDKGIEFRVPSGEQRFSIVVTADIPEGTPAGDYSGGIRLISSLSPDSVGSSTSVSAFIQTNFKIGDEQILENKINLSPKVVGSQKRQVIIVVSVALILIFTIIILALYFKNRKIK